MVAVKERKKAPKEKNGDTLADNRLVLGSVSWKNYEGVLEVFAEQRLRITYDQGTLEIMTVSSKHEEWNRLIDMLILIRAKELTISIKGLGATTFRRQENRRGVAPDNCYWLKEEKSVRDVPQYDPEIHPPPELILEIDVTRSSLDRISIYEALNVKEVWRWDGKIIETRVLSSKKEYSIRNKSAAFPGFKPADLVPFLKTAQEEGEIPMLNAFEKWVREQIEAGNMRSPHKKIT